MRFLTTGLFFFGLAIAVPAADAPAKAAQPAKELDELKKTFEEAQKKYMEDVREQRAKILEALKEAKTDEEKKELQKKLQVAMSGGPGKDFAPKFLALAQKNSKDPAAIDALVSALRSSGGAQAKGTVWPKIVTELQANYVARPEIKKVVRLLASSYDGPSENLVRMVIAKNPDKKVQFAATKALAAGLATSVKLAEQAKGNEALRDRIKEAWGEERLEKVLANADKNKKESEELNTTLKERYADLIPDLSVGKAAPEVVSQDVRGKEARLSALKGKVVVIDVWATWCGPCRAMIPHEREMVERLKDKPFVLVSISADEKKKTLTDFLDKEKMPWTHWWNGNEGGITEDWDVQYFPTIYVIDAKGVIRHKDLRGEELEEAVNKLIKETESK